MPQPRLRQQQIHLRPRKQRRLLRLQNQRLLLLPQKNLQRARRKKIPQRCLLQAPLRPKLQYLLPSKLPHRKTENAFTVRRSCGV
jgi:hypothetical protein